MCDNISSRGLNSSTVPDYINQKQETAACGTNPSSRFAYAASATPPGVSGIAVIRMAGESTFKIADLIFSPLSGKRLSVMEMEGYTAAYGDIINPATKEIIDKVVLTKFIAPHSFTGEDTVEISCHGGVIVKNSILNLLYEAGARPALPGEFTKNAFLNGKLDLAQAEAVMDIISASARKAGSEAVRQLSGKLSEKIRELTSKLYKVLAGVELTIEYPEHEDTKEANENLLEEIENVLFVVEDLIQTFEKGRVLKEGFTVVIAGRPNTGKSSMLNTLAGYGRAIVTEIPGTTRDTIEEMTEISGIPVNLIDTAGLRDSSDTVEKIGVERAKSAIGSADLVLWVFDEDIDDSKIFEEEYSDFKATVGKLPPNKLAIILSKVDLKPFEHNYKNLKKLFPNIPVIPFSSVTQEGLEEVRELILGIYQSLGSSSSQEVVITNSRHVASLKNAKNNLNMAVDGIRSGIPLDVIAGTLRGSAEDLAEITGDEVTEKVIEEIFSRFCIGK